MSYSGNRNEVLALAEVLNMFISVLCVEITKPEPIMSRGRVFHLRFVQKNANFKM